MQTEKNCGPISNLVVHLKKLPHNGKLHDRPQMRMSASLSISDNNFEIKTVTII